MNFNRPIAEQAISVVNGLKPKGEGNLSKGNISRLKQILSCSRLCGGCAGLTLNEVGGIGCSSTERDPDSLAKRLQESFMSEISCGDHDPITPTAQIVIVDNRKNTIGYVKEV